MRLAVWDGAGVGFLASCLSSSGLESLCRGLSARIGHRDFIAGGRLSLQRCFVESTGLLGVRDLPHGNGFGVGNLIEGGKSEADSHATGPEQLGLA